MPESKRPEPKRRSPASRPGRAGDSVAGRPRKSTAARRGQTASRAMPQVVEPIKQAIAESAEQRSDQRLGLTARRAAILAAVVCVLTLTIAGPVRTYFAQRTEMKQLAASEKAMRAQIQDLEHQKDKLGDPVPVVHGAVAHERRPAAQHSGSGRSRSATRSPAVAGSAPAGARWLSAPISTRSHGNSAENRAAYWRSPTAAPTGSRVSSRPRRGFPTAPRFRRCTTSPIPR